MCPGKTREAHPGSDVDGVIGDLVDDAGLQGEVSGGGAGGRLCAGIGGAHSHPREAGRGVLAEDRADAEDVPEAAAELCPQGHLQPAGHVAVGAEQVAEA